MVYPILFISTLVLAGVSELYSKRELIEITKEKKIMSNYLLFFSFTCMFLVSSVRKDVGIDYIQYSSLQIPMVLSGDYSNVEFLYRYVIKIGYLIGKNQMVFVLTHLIILLFSYKAFINNSTNYLFSMYIFLFSGFFNHSLNIMRQSIATAIFLYAIKFIFERKFIKYVISIAVSFLFHKTAIIFFPIYFLYGVRFNIKRSIIILITAIMAKPLVNKGLFFIATNYNIYRNYLNKNFIAAPLSGTYVMINIFVMVLFLTIYILNNNSLNKSQSFYFYIQILTICILIYYDIIPNYDRIMFMLFSCQIFSIPCLIESVKNKKFKKIFTIFTLILYLIVFYRIYVMQNIGGTFPYKSIL